jgi:hypothetical protein
MPVNKKISFSIADVFLAIGAIILVHDFIVSVQKLEELPYSEFRTLVTAGKVAEVTVTNQRLTGKLKPEEGSKEQKLFTTVRVEDPDLVKELNARSVTFSGVIESTFLRDLLSWVVPALIFGGIWFFVIRRFGQGQSGFMTVGQSKAKIYAEKDTKVTFADVAGVDEAKEGLREVEKLIVPGTISRRVEGIWFIRFLRSASFVWFDERERHDRLVHQIDHLCISPPLTQSAQIIYRKWIGARHWSRLAYNRLLRLPCYATPGPSRCSS